MSFLNKKAVTLIELMVTVIIIGILASIALPNFSRAFENTKAKEAVVSLQQIRSGERVYRVAEGSYWGPSSQGSSSDEHIGHIKSINNALQVFLDYRAERNWNYYVQRLTADSFIATAARRSGSHGNQTITIDQTGTLGGTWTLPLPNP